MAYFALDAPPWEEAQDLKGEALDRAREILNERGTPGGKAGWPRPGRPVPEPKGLLKTRQDQASNHDTRQDGTVGDRARSDETPGRNAWVTGDIKVSEESKKLSAGTSPPSLPACNWSTSGPSKARRIWGH